MTRRPPAPDPELHGTDTATRITDIGRRLDRASVTLEAIRAFYAPWYQAIEDTIADPRSVGTGVGSRSIGAVSRPVERHAIHGAAIGQARDDVLRALTIACDRLAEAETAMQRSLRAARSAETAQAVSQARCAGRGRRDGSCDHLAVKDGLCSTCLTAA